ncbi:Methionine aminotransferase [Sporomusa silvacetica DSM 10669]|uniref:Aminotransferase n=2 Tax=Sporomusa silvacetica TaxID=55504 RepID=A0ABZ3IH49_9FIRM|nr:methionine aminotransferase [Sporomusa silvacetica DSM 10669]
MLSQRIQNIDFPVFGRIAALARNKDVIRLDAGEPDFPAPALIKDAAVAAIAADYNQYAPVPGLEELRRGIAAKIQEREGMVFEPLSQITVCCGATEGLAAAFLAIVNPGDEVILLEPAYTVYTPDVLLCGGSPVYVKLSPPEFRIERHKLEAAVSPRTKAIIINSPHNPTGRIYSQEELSVIAEFCLRHNLIAITDEVYEELTYDGVKMERLWKIPGMEERTIIVSGFSKTFSVTGWRLGYVVAPVLLSRGVQLAHNYLTVGTAAPLQRAAVTASQMPADYYRTLAALLQQRRDILLDGLRKVGFECRCPQGGYFILADCSRFGWQDDWSLAQYLIEEIGVAAIPLSGFYKKYPADNPVFLRFAFCKREETIRTAVERLQRLKLKVK